MIEMGIFLRLFDLGLLKHGGLPFREGIDEDFDLRRRFRNDHARHHLAGIEHEGMRLKLLGDLFGGFQDRAQQFFGGVFLRLDFGQVWAEFAAFVVELVAADAVGHFEEILADIERAAMRQLFDVAHEIVVLPFGVATDRLQEFVANRQRMRRGTRRDWLDTPPDSRRRTTLRTSAASGRGRCRHTDKRRAAEALQSSAIDSRPMPTNDFRAAPCWTWG